MLKKLKNVKGVYLLLPMFLALQLQAQQVADTVLTPDPLNPGHIYCQINNPAGNENGYLVNGLKEGVQRIYHYTGSLHKIMEYKNGKH